jgi:PAS domain S-box-containing protein
MFEASTYLVKDASGKPIKFRSIARDVTDRKRMESELKKSEEKYRLVVENANEAIIVAQDGILKFANPKAAELSGYSADELISMPFVKLIYHDDVEMVAERHQKRLRGEELPSTYPFRVITKNGNTRSLDTGLACTPVVLAEFVVVLLAVSASMMRLVTALHAARTRVHLLRFFCHCERLRMWRSVRCFHEAGAVWSRGPQKRQTELCAPVAAVVAAEEVAGETVRVLGGKRAFKGLQQASFI